MWLPIGPGGFQVGSRRLVRGARSGLGHEACALCDNPSAAGFASRAHQRRRALAPQLVGDCQPTAVVTGRRGERGHLVDNHFRLSLEDRLTHRCIIEPVHQHRSCAKFLDQGKVDRPTGAGRDLFAPVQQRIDERPTLDPCSPCDENPHSHLPVVANACVQRGSMAGRFAPARVPGPATGRPDPSATAGQTASATRPARGSARVPPWFDARVQTATVPLSTERGTR